eukprot:2391325-Lingulodinium_polyedra.AAC.1
MALVGLLTQWSCKATNPERAASVQGLLKALVARTLQAETFEAELVLDPEAVCLPGLFAEGNDHMVVQITAGM